MPHGFVEKPSSDGFLSPVYACCDNQRWLIGFILTDGEISNYAVADALVALPLPKSKALLAYKGCDGDPFLENLLTISILTIVVARLDRADLRIIQDDILSDTIEYTMKAYGCGWDDLIKSGERMPIESAEIKDSWTILEGPKSNNGGQGGIRSPA